jgi:hypothetical protein
LGFRVLAGTKGVGGHGVPATIVGTQPRHGCTQGPIFATYEQIKCALFERHEQFAPGASESFVLAYPAQAGGTLYIEADPDWACDNDCIGPPPGGYIPPAVVEYESSGPENDIPPCASPESYSVPTGKTLRISAATGLLRNDFDPDQEALHVRLTRISFGYAKLNLDASSGAFTFKAGSKPGTAKIDYVAVDEKGVESQPATASISIGHPELDAKAAPCTHDRALQGTFGSFIGAKQFEKTATKQFRDTNGRPIKLSLNVTYTAFRWGNHVEVKGAASIRTSPSVRYLCLNDGWTISSGRGVSSVRPFSEWEGEGHPYMIDYTGGKPAKSTETWPFQGPALEKTGSSYLGIAFSERQGVLTWDSPERRIMDIHFAVTGAAGSRPGCTGNRFSLNWHK